MIMHLVWKNYIENKHNRAREMAQPLKARLATKNKRE